MNASQLIAPILNRNLIFVHGKGGVGKTVTSQAIALCLSAKNERTLWVTLEDPTLEIGKLKEVNPHLWHLNCDFTLAFEEYALMKIGVPRLTQLFLKNKLMRYLAKAAPGIHELVLLGKIWFERLHYSHVVVDMPSTGYGLALFQSAENFSKLFRTGPLHKDAESMIQSFKDPHVTGHVIVALPEETPLRESLELNDFLKKLFPENPAAFLANRLFPKVPQKESETESEAGNPALWSSPLALSMEDYVQKRYWLENHNMRLWRDADIHYGELTFIPPPVPSAITSHRNNPLNNIVSQLAEQLHAKAYL